MQVGGIVLCGGQSRRMGASKAMLPFGPEMMLQRVVRLLGQKVQPLAVVAAPGQSLPPLPPETLIVRDREEGHGPLEGLHAGLDALASCADAAYATGCDAPFLNPNFVGSMIHQLSGHDIAVPVDGQSYHPLAAVYRTSVLRLIEQLLDRQQRKPRLLYDLVPTRLVPVACLEDIDPGLLTLRNLNHPEDYLAALAMAGFDTPSDFSRLL
jgi:molybdopterin-guanine dinucleotide biosynthesis protein A